MGGRQRRPRTTLAGRLVRGRRFDRNPLRRAADRAETRVLILLVTVFRGAELAQTASRRQVTAVILTDAGDSTVGAWDMAAVAQARWTAPDGSVVKGGLPVDAGTKAGTTVRFWTTRDGQLSSHPMSDSQVASLAALGEAAGPAAVALVLALAGVLVRWSLNRRRMAGWEADWQATGPRWATRT